MPVLASVGLASRLSDALYKCFVELLKKWTGYNGEAGTYREALSGVGQSDADGRVGHDG